MCNWLIVLYFAHSTVTIDGRQTIPPPVVDPGTYSCSTYFRNQYIECELEICEVRCDATGGCYNLTINASLSTKLILDCVEEQSCQQLVVVAPSSHLEINCTKAESCDEAHILAQNTSKISVQCSAFHACRGIVIEADTVTNELNLNCMNDDACYQSKIHCPRDASCNIQCLNHTSCQSVELFITDALDNTLNMQCSNSTQCTGVVHAAHDGFAMSNFMQNPSTNALYCSSHASGSCPFFEDIITCAPGTDCVVDCSETTNTTCVGFKIDATDAKSLSLQCGAGYGCEKALIQCPIRNDAICDIACNSCGQIFIKPSTNTTLSCIGSSSCANMLLALNRHLNQFTAECDGSRACSYASVISIDYEETTQPSIDRFDMKCNDKYACERIKIDLQMSSDVNGHMSDEFSLICTGDYACYYFDLSFNGNIDTASIQCGNPSYYPMVKQIGPYADTANRSLRYGPQTSGYRVFSCRDACPEYKYFALQEESRYAYTCSCDNDLAHATMYGPGQCDPPFGANGCNYIFENLLYNLSVSVDLHYRTCYRGVITHSGQLMNTLDVHCEGDETCKSLDINLHAQYVKEFVWDCLDDESVGTCCACQGGILVSEANVDEMNVTCSGYNTCYNTEWHIGSPTTSSLATINRWNLQCIDDGAVHYSDGDLSCVYADIYVYSEKRINYLDIECDGGEMECFNLMTRLHGNAVIDYWNMECFDGSWNCEWVYMIFSDDSILSHANVNCDGDGRDGTCLGLWYDFDAYTSSEPLEMIYNCNTPHACEGGDINGRDLPSTLHITLNCNAADSCRNFVLDIEDSYYDSATRSWMSRAMDFGKFTLNCNGTNACNGMTIMCPMNENACNIECSAHDGSCENIDIVALTDSYPFGYLDLQCPSPETYTNNTACDGVTIGCSDTKLDIEYIYDYSAHQYTCSNTSDTHCCPLNGISSNPTHHPTVFTSNPTVDPTTDPTRHPSVQPTYNPTLEPTLPSLNPTVASQEPTMPTVYPVTVVIQIEYVFEDIPLDLITEIVEQTVNYVLNTSDLIESCGLTDDELRVNKTESGIQLSGQILACLDQAPQLVLITELVSELKGEIIDNINVETRLSITEHDVSLDVDVVNPSLSQQVTSNPIATHESTLISNDATQSGNIFTIRNISIVVTAVLILLLLFAAIYVYRRYKIKKVKKIEGNMQIEPAEMAATGAQKVIEESTENMQNTNCTNDNDGGNIETDDKEIVEMAIFSELPDEMEGEKAVVDTIGEASITFDGHTMNEKEQMGNGNTDNGACDV
eukprot:596672_1